ncbi:MAG: dTMP kinase [Acidobacteriota bacterium]
MTPPSFITFEGLDGSGKSSHLQAVAERLRASGIDVCVTREPGGTALGSAIRDVFLDPQWGRLDGRVEMMLVFASRRQHLIEVIEPALLEGKVVLCDRFTDSTYAYQGSGRGVSYDVIDRVDRLSTERRRPDRTVLLDLPAEVAQSRGQSASRRGGIDRLDAEELDFYRRVRQGFLDLAEAESERFRVVDTSQERGKARSEVADALADLLGDAVMESS